MYLFIIGDIPARQALRFAPYHPFLYPVRLKYPLFLSPISIVLCLSYNPAFLWSPIYGFPEIIQGRAEDSA